MNTIGRTFALIAAGLVPALAPADAARGEKSGLSPQVLAGDTLDALRWQARPVVVLGTGAEAKAQIAALQAGAAALVERDVVLLIDGPGAAPLRERVGTGFAVLLIGKDGGVKLSRKAPVAVAEITGLIDTMPMRRREAAEGE